MLFVAFFVGNNSSMASRIAVSTSVTSQSSACPPGKEISDAWRDKFEARLVNKIDGCP